jgi:hypothetical protein
MCEIGRQRERQVVVLCVRFVAAASTIYKEANAEQA